MSQKSDSCGKTAFLSSTQLYWAPCFLMFSLPTYRATSTECCHLQIQRGRSKSETQSSDSRFSVSKPLCVEPDAQSSGVPLIKVLTCFDMHERVSSFCFSVTIFFLLQELFWQSQERTTKWYCKLYCKKRCVHSGFGHKLHKHAVILGAGNI